MKCELCHVREAGCVLHREKDGGEEELYVCEVCRKGDAQAKQSQGIATPALVEDFFKGIADIGARVAKDIAREIAKHDAQKKEEDAQDGEEFDFDDTEQQEPFLGEELEFVDGEPQEPRCSFCGMPRSELRRGQRLGCPACYKAFTHEIALMIRDMHKGTRHVEEEE